MILSDKSRIYYGEDRYYLYRAQYHRYWRVVKTFKLTGLTSTDRAYHYLSGHEITKKEYQAWFIERL